LQADALTCAAADVIFEGGVGVLSAAAKPRIGGELRLRGSIGPGWIPFETQICEVEHDESTDRTNGDKQDSVAGADARFRCCSLRSQASLPFPQPMMASTHCSPRSCSALPVRGSQRHPAQSRSCIADDTDALVRRV
jgi:hypothetical protein